LGLFGKAPAPPKIALALAQVEWLLWWSWGRFKKCWAKQILVLVSTHEAAWNHVSLLHLSSGSRKGLQVRLRLELLQNELFGGASAGAHFTVLLAPCAWAVSHLRACYCYC